MSTDSADLDKSKAGEETMTVMDVKQAHDRILEEVGNVIIGRVDILTFLWICMLTNKHAYLEGVPGVAKSVTANSFSITMGCEFSRIQFTPDMLPSDIVGTNIFNPKTGTFRLKKGPIFGNVILADEINRAPPKTQSAMLEAMAEGQVSIEGETHTLAKPFVVIATANPVEQEGTYPLPEAQLDRFLLKLEVNYGTSEDELNIIKLKNNPIDYKLQVITSPQSIVKMSQVVRRVHINDDVMSYIRDIVIRTREDARLIYGCSPRASISLLESAKALAACRGRAYVVPDDIKFMIKHVLQHRLLLKPEAELEGLSGEKIALDVQQEIPVPVDFDFSAIMSSSTEDDGDDDWDDDD